MKTVFLLRALAISVVGVWLAVGCAHGPATEPASNDAAGATDDPRDTTSSGPDATANAGETTNRPARPDPADAGVDATGLLPAGASASADGIELRTDHDEAFAAERMAECQLAFERLRHVFPPRGDPQPVRILIYGTAEAYRAYADRRAPENADVLGYYDPVRREIVITFTGSLPGLFSTILHECTHLVLRDHLGTRFLPPWLDEGLASCYETGRIDEVSGELVFGRVHPVYARVVRENLADGRELDLDKLATMGFSLFATANRPQLHQNYAVAWSLLYYILHGERGLYHPTLQLYLTEIAAAPDATTRYPVVYRTVFGPRRDALLAGWRAWAKTAGR